MKFIRVERESDEAAVARYRDKRDKAQSIKDESGRKSEFTIAKLDVFDREIGKWGLDKVVATRRLVVCNVLPIPLLGKRVRKQ